MDHTRHKPRTPFLKRGSHVFFCVSSLIGAYCFVCTYLHGEGLPDRFSEVTEEQFIEEMKNSTRRCREESISENSNNNHYHHLRVSDQEEDQLLRHDALLVQSSMPDPISICTYNLAFCEKLFTRMIIIIIIIIISVVAMRPRELRSIAQSLSLHGTHHTLICLPHFVPCLPIGLTWSHRYARWLCHVTHICICRKFN